MNAWSFVSVLIWQVILACTLWYLRKPLEKLLQRRISGRWKDAEIAIDADPLVTDEQQMDDAAVQLESLIRQRGPHSFKYYRDETNIRYSDDGFRKLIERSSDKFTEVRIIQRDENGNRIIPGLPGVDLKAHK